MQVIDLATTAFNATLNAAFNATQYHSTRTAAGQMGVINGKFAKTEKLQDDIIRAIEDLPQRLPEGDKEIRHTKTSRAKLFGLNIAKQAAEETMENMTWAQRNLYRSPKDMGDGVSFEKLKKGVDEVWKDVVVCINVRLP
jgi:hypothetical protein